MVWWPEVFIHVTELDGCIGVARQVPIEVDVGEEAVVGPHMVHRCWLVVPQMSEGGGV